MKVSVLTTAPTVEPLKVQEVKDNLKITGTDDDSRLEGLITSARLWCEGYTNRSFIKQTRIQYMDDFWQPCDYRPIRDRSAIELLQGPLLDVAGVTVIAVRYYDENDTLQTVSAGDYWIDAKRPIPRVYVKESWPTTKVRPNAVEIEYYAGYGTTAASVPQYFKDAMHLYIAHCYENRVPEITGVSISAFELGIKRLLDMGTSYQNAF
jgi:uncharacterized phiE125 gp8 family phage protein